MHSVGGRAAVVSMHWGGPDQQRACCFKGHIARKGQLATQGWVVRIILNRRLGS